MTALTDFSWLESEVLEELLGRKPTPAELCAHAHAVIDRAYRRELDKERNNPKKQRLLEAIYAVAGEVEADPVDIELATSGKIDHQTRMEVAWEGGINLIYGVLLVADKANRKRLLRKLSRELKDACDCDIADEDQGIPNHLKIPTLPRFS
jgi:hypothetical protein